MIEVVEIREQDVNFVRRILERRWHVSQIQSYWFVKNYLCKKSNCNCWVALKGKARAGMGAFHVDNDIGVDLHPWCIGLWVNERYRGDNIGWLITEKRFEWARSLGYDKIYLDTVNAENYHKKFGCERTGITAKNQGLKTIVMEHDL